MNIGEMLDRGMQEMQAEIDRLRERVLALEGTGAAPLAYTIDGAAEVLSVSTDQVRALVRSGKVESFTLGSNSRRKLIYRRDLEDYIERCKSGIA